MTFLTIENRAAFIYTTANNLTQSRSAVLGVHANKVAYILFTHIYRAIISYFSQLPQ